MSSHEANPHVSDANIRGLPALPVELFLEIISYFPTDPIASTQPCVSPEECSDQRWMSHILSQTCLSLRETFLPLTWQRIEVRASPGPTGCSVSVLDDKRDLWEKGLVDKLLRQLKVVTVCNPSLAAHVQIFNVVISKIDADTVLPELARCMALLPNLHTVQIPQAHWSVMELVRSAFAGYLFPSVHTVAAPFEASGILSRCPEVRRVICTSGFFEPTLSAISCGCPNVEYFDDFDNINYDRFFDRIIDIMPNLRSVSLMVQNTTLTAVKVKSLSKLMRLERIEFDVNCNMGETLSPRAEELVELAKEILINVPSRDKCLTLKYIDGRERIVVS